MNPETPRSASPLSLPIWKPKRPKNYPHFDGHLAPNAVHKLVTTPSLVAKNPFYPFIVFTKKFNRFGNTTPRSERAKARDLRYAARKDSYIYEFYRGILSPLYEVELKKRSLSANVIAYRKLKTTSGRGMCSIDFAKEAFVEIASRGYCVAIAMDVSSYFESLDHALIKKQWCRLLGGSTLPEDHYAVFKAITRYCQVNRDDVYKRLGITGTPVRARKYSKPVALIPTQLCSAQDFRNKIVKPGDLIWRNCDSFGIPQGSPISDLIANFYLLDFDQEMKAFADSVGGFYRRYSDDILFIYSKPELDWADVEARVRLEIEKHGDQLKIKHSKTCVHSFSGKSGNNCLSLKGDEKRFEYLGFQFDGIAARFRDKTVSAFYRKLKWAIYGEARDIVRRFPGKPKVFLDGKFDEGELLQRFGRRKGFGENADVHQWTFWTYATRSTEIMKPFGSSLYKQISNYKRFVRRHRVAALDKALENSPKSAGLKISLS